MHDTLATHKDNRINLKLYPSQQTSNKLMPTILSSEDIMNLTYLALWGRINRYIFSEIDHDLCNTFKQEIHAWYLRYGRWTESRLSVWQQRYLCW